MNRKILTRSARLLCILALAVSMATAAFADDPPEPTQPSPCYPTAVTRSEDGGEIRKMYDLGPEDDPAGIPRSDFEQDGYHYTLTDLLRQELPANESRQHTETVSVASQSKDMASVLALLPEKKEFITDDGLSGVLTLKLDTVNVEVAGYGSSTRTLTATRTYPGLANQDTQFIPKSIQDNGNSLTFQTVNWQTEGDGHFTAVASYSGSATSSYVTGYTVTADYTGTVSRIKRRLVNPEENWAVFENHHEAIIDPATWEQVQKLREGTKRRKPKKTGKSMFAGLLYCADCGHKLHYNFNHINTSIEYFNCSNYRGNRGTCNETHYIRTDSLEQVVLLELNRLVSYLKHHEEEFAELLAQKTTKDYERERQNRRQRLQEMIARNKDCSFTDECSVAL